MQASSSTDEHKLFAIARRFYVQSCARAKLWYERLCIRAKPWYEMCWVRVKPWYEQICSLAKPWYEKFWARAKLWDEKLCARAKLWDDWIRKLAKRWYQDNTIDPWYGVIDGFNTAALSVKGGCDIASIVTDVPCPDIMHDFVLSPVGIVFVSLESVFFIGFSYFGNVWSDTDKHPGKKYTTIAWSYGREGIKSVKAAHKGSHSAIQIIELLSSHDLRYVMLPTGAVLAFFAVVNRAVLRNIRNKRRVMQSGKISKDGKRIIKSGNVQLLYKVKKTGLQLVDADEIWRESKRLRVLALGMSVYAGVIDGLYLYMGVFSLAVLTPSLLVIVVACSAIFTLSCVLTRLYEEHQYQQELEISAVRVELALSGNSLKKLSQDYLSCICSLDVVDAQWLNFKQKRAHLRSLLRLSYTEALLAGLKNGLAGYLAILAAFFAISIISTILNVTFSPALLLAGIGLGLLLLVGLMAHSLNKQSAHIKAQDSKFMAEPPYTAEQLSLQADFTQIIDAQQDLEPPPISSFLSWSEVGRSLCSGVGKAHKGAVFSLGSMQGRDGDGHIHDPSNMLWPIWILTILNSAVLTGRAIAREFGRPPPLNEDLSDDELVIAVETPLLPVSPSITPNNVPYAPTRSFMASLFPAVIKPQPYTIFSNGTPTNSSAPPSITNIHRKPGIHLLSSYERTTGPSPEVINAGQPLSLAQPETPLYHRGRLFPDLRSNPVAPKLVSSPSVLELCAL